MKIENQDIRNALPLLRAGRSNNIVGSAHTHFLFESTTDQLTFTATNHSSETRCTIAVKDGSVGSAVVPPEFADIIDKSANAPVNIKLTDAKATLSVGGMKAHLKILPAEAFPRFVMGETRQMVKLSSASLKKVLQETVDFAPSNDPRHFLNGVRLELAGDKLYAVATNTHVIAISSASTGLKIEQPIARIIPIAVIPQLIKTMQMADEVELAIADASLQFTCGGASIAVKHIDGSFPDWRKLLSSLPASDAIVVREDLRAAVARASILAEVQGKGAGKATKIELAKSGLHVITKGTDGESTDLVKYKESQEVVAKSASMSIDYLNLAVSNFDSENLRISYSLEPTSLIWFRKQQSNDSVVIVSPRNE